MYVLICHTDVMPEKAELYESTFRDLAKIVREKESGVLFYELTKNHNKPSSYILVEAYNDQAAQDIHLNTDYYQQHSEIIYSCIEGNPDVQVYETVGH